MEGVVPFNKILHVVYSSGLPSVLEMSTQGLQALSAPADQSWLRRITSAFMGRRLSVQDHVTRSSGCQYGTCVVGVKVHFQSGIDTLTRVTVKNRRAIQLVNVALLSSLQKSLVTYNIGLDHDEIFSGAVSAPSEDGVQLYVDRKKSHGRNDRGKVDWELFVKVFSFVIIEDIYGCVRVLDEDGARELASLLQSALFNIKCLEAFCCVTDRVNRCMTGTSFLGFCYLGLQRLGLQAIRTGVSLNVSLVPSNFCFISVLDQGLLLKDPVFREEPVVTLLCS